MLPAMEILIPITTTTTTIMIMIDNDNKITKVIIPSQMEV